MFNMLRSFLGEEPKANPFDLDLLCRLFMEWKLERDKLDK